MNELQAICASKYLRINFNFSPMSVWHIETFSGQGEMIWKFSWKNGQANTYAIKKLKESIANIMNIVYCVAAYLMDLSGCTSDIRVYLNPTRRPWTWQRGDWQSYKCEFERERAHSTSWQTDSRCTNDILMVVDFY